MNSEQRLRRSPVGKSSRNYGKESIHSPVISPLQCRKELFQRSPHLFLEGVGSPAIKVSCNCRGQNWTGKSGHTRFCPTVHKPNRSRHSSRGSLTRGVGERHPSGDGGSNFSDYDVSKLITEEEFLDVIFFSCDVEETGQVLASVLLEHVRDMCGTQEIEELATLMDPSGKDAKIDLLTYRNTMTRWIHILQPDRCDQMNESLDLQSARPIQQSTPCSNSSTCSKDSLWRRREDKKLALDPDMQDLTGITDVSYGSLEAMGGEPSVGEIDLTADLQNKIDKLEFHVKKLSEQNGKLQKQMEATEDNNAQLIAETDELRRRVKSTQQVTHRNTSIREENEELKGLVFSTEEDKKKIQRKVHQLEKERGSLKIKTRNLQDELDQVTMESENIQAKFTKLEADLKEYKGQCEHAEYELEKKNEEYEEKSKKCEVLTASLEDLHSFNKALKSEKFELENKVAELKQDLCIYQQGQSPQIAAATCALPDIYKTFEEKHEHHSDLHSELNQLVLADEGLPSPLCGTPFVMPPPVSSPVLDPNSATEEMMKNFQHQRQEMQDRIQQLLQQVSVLREGHKGPNGFSSNLMAEQLQSDMTSLLSTMTKVVEAKRSSDLRNSKLTDIIKQLRDTNLNIKSKYEESKRLVEAFSSLEEQLENVREENENLKLTNERLKAQVNELEIQLSRTKTEVATIKDEAHTLTDTLQTQMEHRELAEQQLQQLKRSYAEIDFKSTHNENLVKHLKTDVSTKDSQLLEEQSKCSELQNNLYAMQVAHQRDLEAILDVILLDLRDDEEVDEDYDDSRSPSRGTPSPVDEDDKIVARQPSRELSAEQVRETVQKRLVDLRRQLSSARAFSDPTSESAAASRILDINVTGLAGAHRPANGMAESYTRGNLLTDHDTRDEQNNNEHKRERSSSLTNTRKTLQMIGRRHSDQEFLTSRGDNSQLLDFVNDNLEEVKMSPEEQRLSGQLLVDARKASERFKNRRGRRWSSESSISSNGERSPPHSGGSSPRDRSPESQHRSSLSEIDVAPSKGNGFQLSSENGEAADAQSHDIASSDSQTREFTQENGRVHVEERTVAEGESDTEENTSPSCNRRNKPRSDSDVDEIDIKADILKNIGPIQSEGGQTRSKEPMVKKREEQKLKRNVSFKMPELPEVQEVNGNKETDTSAITSDVDATNEVPNQTITKPQENGTTMTESPRLRKQSEIDVESPPRLVPNSLLETLGSLSSKEECLILTNMTAQEIEDKYKALASALRLDKHTLQKRIELMKHQRDLSELCIERELTAVEECLKNLKSKCEHDPTSKECLDKLHRQADGLRKMSVWLAGRAEGLGAVQEESRLSDATEIMVCHVENLRRLYEREHLELEEARKLLQENRAFLRAGSVSPGAMTSFDDSRLGRRAFSITPGSKTGRRASVAVLGYAGAQLASTSQEGRSRWSLIASKAKSVGRQGRQSLSEGVANRTENTDGEESPLPSPINASSSAHTSPSTSPRSSLKAEDTETPASPSRKSGSETAETRTKKEEEIYQQGYEQGVRAKVSEELTDLREQQTNFCENLETLMENAAEEEERDEQEQKEQETSTHSHLLPWRWAVFQDDHQIRYFRLGLASFLFLFLLFGFVLQNLPIDMCDPGKPVTRSPLYAVCEILRPLVRLTHEAPPPI